MIFCLVVGGAEGVMGGIGVSGDEAMWEEAEVLIVADDDVIKEVDVEKGAFVDFARVQTWLGWGEQVQGCTRHCICGRSG